MGNITYTIEENGKASLSRANENDLVPEKFLSFLANDIKHNPSNIRSISPALMKRSQNLTSGVEIDLDAPLDNKDN